MILAMSRERPLPLFPLPNVVHFPQTDLRLHIFEPRYRAMVRDLLEMSESERLIGMVLTQSQDVEPQSPAVYERGTAGLVVDVEALPDGRSNIRLTGQYRFRIDRELPALPYRRALVTPLGESSIDETVTRDRRRNLLQLMAHLEEHGAPLPAIPGDDPFVLSLEALVNGIAANLDLPALAKLDLLHRDLRDRADHVVSILEARRRVVDMLHPFRALSATPDLN
jgi:Lon protease-like protein